MCEGPSCAASALAQYVARLQAAGFADETADVATAVSMFVSSMFGDAISRDVLPHAFPQPEEAAPAKYVNVFLRAVGVSSAGGAVPLRTNTAAQAERATA